MDVVALPETQSNWNNPFVVDQWKSVIKKVWPKSLVLTASISDGDVTSEYKPGGVSMILQCTYASMVTESGKDTQGRWVWATLEGKDDGKLTLITM